MMRLMGGDIWHPGDSASLRPLPLSYSSLRTHDNGPPPLYLSGGGQAPGRQMSLTKSIPELELTVTEAWPPSAKGRGMGPAGYKSSAKQMTKETVGGYGVERSETEPSVTTNSNSKALEDDLSWNEKRLTRRSQPFGSELYRVDYSTRAARL